MAITNSDLSHAELPEIGKRKILSNEEEDMGQKSRQYSGASVSLECVATSVLIDKKAGSAES